MLPIATILHPTDFSDASSPAFHLACSLARDHGGRVILLHVAELPIVVSGGSMSAPLPGGNRQVLQDQLRAMQASAPEVHVEVRLEEGDPVAEILRFAEAIQCDLIVMGTHGRTGLAHLLMGSVAERVVRKASCPVLVVKTPIPEDRREGSP